MKLTDEELEELESQGFDEAGFVRVWGDYAGGRWERELVVAPDRLAPPAEGDLASPPEPGSDLERRLSAAGRDHVEAGRFGVLVLNGGMATRFGGVVKGTVEVVDGRSFLELKIAQIRKVAPRAPIFLMNSPATHRPTLEHLAERRIEDEAIFHFIQPVAPRVSLEGKLVREEDERLSVTGMGHGDALAAFRTHGLERFAGSGGRTIMVSNVDNLGATVDPVLVGLHLHLGRRVSVEVARRRPSDKGGMPVLLDGRLMLLEGLRWPPDMDGPGYRAFNTNTFYIEREVFEDPPELAAYPVRKEVRGRPVVQFERILGEVTHHVDTAFILVEQEGGSSRFIPVKRREDLASQAPVISAVMRGWEVV
jgi:UTP--glucose-1-phosphate uridylyltransferase